MRLPQGVRQQEASYAQLERRERNHRLAIVREHLRQVDRQIFEISCQLQREFDAKYAREALVLVAEFKTLKAYEEMLEQKIT